MLWLAGFADGLDLAESVSSMFAGAFSFSQHHQVNDLRQKSTIDSELKAPRLTFSFALLLVFAFVDYYYF